MSEHASIRLHTWLLVPLLLLLCGAAGAAPNYPFGSHRQPYVSGTLGPGVGQASADQATAAFYATWKSRYLVPGCTSGDYRVKADTATAHTVSEGQGYGMLIAVMMAGHDPDAQVLFDGLHRYNRRHPSTANPDLLAWAQDAQCRNVGGASSATDGDLDIAYALLLADLQWGSGGTIDYAGEARRVIDAIRTSNIHPSSRLVNLGDWVHPGSPQYYNATRSSDWMPGHFRAFAAGRGGDWSSILDDHQTLLGRMQRDFAPTTGLLPDFIVDAHLDPRPAPPHFLEADTDGTYSWNAGRVPWRIGIDAAVSGDIRSRDAARRLSQWIRAHTDGDPTRIRAGYRLDGTPSFEYSSMFFTAPFAVAAMNDPGAQAWLDRLWNQMAASSGYDYYSDSVQLLSMLAVSNNWLRP